MRLSRISFLTVLCPVFLYSQNLVPNPGFEETISCPGSYSRSKDAFKIKEWYAPNSGTPDAFNECGRGEADVPYNWAGVSEAYEGKGYAGIFLFIKYKTFREYLQCKLNEPLIKDTTYRVSFRYRLSSYSKYSIDRIGLHITDSAVIVKHDRSWDIDPILCAKSDSALNPRTGLWEIASFEYKARGGEQFVTIGNFHDNNSTRNYEIQHRPVQELMLADAAYYYIDDVVLRPKYEPSFLTPDVTPFSHEKVNLNERYVLDNILFDFNSFKLLARSFEQLDQVVGVLRRNPAYKVEVNGYTDDVGSESYNLQLSRKRAQTVAKYLVNQGIPHHRVESFGFGKKYPLLEGNSEEIRRINRRVELKFFQ